MSTKTYKIVFCTPAIYSAGGVERVVSYKASYFAEQLGYDVTIIVTEGKGRECYFPLSDKVKVINFELGFEELWKASFIKKVFLYLTKQRQYKRLLKAELMRIRPDFTISMLRREINFLTDIHDGSKKIGELHVNRANYRNFEQCDANFIKNLFAKFWMRSLVGKLKRLDRFVVLTEEDKLAWPELTNVCVIPDPLSFKATRQSPLTAKRVIAVGRYVYQKGFDLLLQAWAKVEKECPDWQLAIYGDGDRAPYQQQMKVLGIDSSRCHLNGSTSNIQQEYANSSLFVFSSRFEGFGMVLVEAMSCGLPVVSFACPCGPKDIVRDGEDGLLAENGSVEDLSNYMIKLISDNNLRYSFSQKAKTNVKRFEMANILTLWRMLFDSLTI